MTNTLQQEMPTPGGSPPQSHESILVEILQIALSPGLLTNKSLKIFDYLFAIDALHFQPKAAIFLVEQNEQKLSLKASRGFSQLHGNCSEISFGQCHCGASAQVEISRFFRNKPPFLNTDANNSEPFWGNYCIPISKDGMLYGLFTIYVTEDHKSDLSIRQLLNAVANVFAVIIESQKMDQQMIQLVNYLRSSIVNLREEKKFSESIIQGLNHGLLVVDLDGRIRKSNGVARKILQPFTKHLDSQYLSDFLPKDVEKELLTMQTVNKNIQDRELTLQTESGDRKIISYSNVPREDTLGRLVWGNHLHVRYFRVEIHPQGNGKDELAGNRRRNRIGCSPRGPQSPGRDQDHGAVHRRGRETKQ